jgi:hypothetical protein
MAKIDLKDAYFTIPIWKNHQKFLRFLWKDTQWEFMCLPFGLASAPHVFTKILKPIVGLLRKQGIRLIIYLDDILLMASTAETLSHHVALTVALLELLGFVVNYQKSQLNPVQSLEFLGFQINSVTFQISLPKRQSKKHQTRMSESPRPPNNNGERISQVIRQVKCLNSSSFPGTAALSLPPSCQKTKLGKTGELRGSSDLVSGSPRGAEMVARSPYCLEWKGSVERASNVDHRDRCIDNRLGSSLWANTNEGPLVSNRRAPVTHKLSGTPCRGVHSQIISKEQMQYPCFVAHGQHVSHLWSQTEERLLHINCLELLAGGFALK